MHQGFHPQYSANVAATVNALKSVDPPDDLLPFQLLAMLLRDAIHSCGANNINAVPIDPANLTPKIANSMGPGSNTRMMLNDYNDDLIAAAQNGLTDFVAQADRFSLFLNRLPKSELTRFANGLEIDLEDASKKADIIQKILTYTTNDPTPLAQASFDAANQQYYEQYGQKYLLVQGEKVLSRGACQEIFAAYQDRVCKDGGIYMRFLLDSFS